MNVSFFKQAVGVAIAATICSACSSSSGGSNEYTLDSISEYSWNNSFKPYTNDTGVVDKFADLRIYQVMVESFQNGDDSRNYNVGYGNSDHTGDLQGIINALPYIQNLGMNAIWLTPIFESAPENGEASMLDATGYYTRNYYKVDRRFGDEKTLHELITKAHELGLYVFLDGVFGHFRTDLENTSPRGNSVSMTDKCVGSNLQTFVPPKDTTCSDFSDQGQSIAYMKEVAEYYIDNFKIDGWRLDQAYQLPPKDLKEIRASVEAASNRTTYTSSEGKEVHPLGYIVGEIWSDNKTIANTGYGTPSDPILFSNFDFAMRYGIVQTLAMEEHGKRNQSGFNLEDMLRYDENNIPNHAYPNLMITNHDLLRFGDLVQRAHLDSTYDQRVKLALSYLAVVHSGPITNYYGEEIGQEVPNYAAQVATMGWRDDHVARDNGHIDNLTAEQSSVKDQFTFLMKLRGQHGALSNGRLEIIKVKTDLFSVKKTFKGDDSFIYLMNLNSNKPLNIKLTKDIVGSENLTVLEKDNCTALQANADGSFTVTLQPLTFKLLQTGTNAKCNL